MRRDSVIGIVSEPTFGADSQPDRHDVASVTNCDVISALIAQPTTTDAASFFHTMNGGTITNRVRRITPADQKSVLWLTKVQLVWTLVYQPKAMVPRDGSSGTPHIATS